MASAIGVVAIVIGAQNDVEAMKHASEYDNELIEFHRLMRQTANPQASLDDRRLAAYDGALVLRQYLGHFMSSQAGVLDLVFYQSVIKSLTGDGNPAAQAGFMKAFTDMESIQDTP